MGNCLFGGLGREDDEIIKVITSNGGVMEFYPPITASCISIEFPGHAIFRSQDLFWKPLSHDEDLLPGKSYYLLPLNGSTFAKDKTAVGGCQIVREGHVRSNSIPTSLVAPSYRMSFDYQGTLKRSYTEVFSRYNSIDKTSSSSSSSTGSVSTNRFWKVKLVIDPQQLLEILSQDSRTEELIESVRTVAKCGNGGLSSSSISLSTFSDQWSLSSSSKNASSSKKDYLLLDM